MKNYGKAVINKEKKVDKDFQFWTFLKMSKSEKVKKVFSKYVKKMGLTKVERGILGKPPAALGQNFGSATI